jgi:hypothetical protein
MEVSPFTYEQLGYGPNFNIALNMSLEQFKFYCVSNELFRKICSNQDFWLQRLQNEYPTLIQNKPVNMTYGQYYIYLKGRKFIAVAYNNQIVGTIQVQPKDYSGDVYDKALAIIKSIDPNASDRYVVALLKFKKLNFTNEEVTDSIDYETRLNNLYRSLRIIENKEPFVDVISIFSDYNHEPVKQFTRHV